MYLLPINGLTEFNPADATEYFVGAAGPGTDDLTGTARVVRATLAGIVVAATIHVQVNGDLPSSENVIMQVGANANRETISSAGGLNWSGGGSTYSDQVMSLAFSNNNTLRVVFTTPTWVTNPTQVIVWGHLFCTNNDEETAFALQDTNIANNDSDISGILAGSILDNGVSYAGQLTAEEIRSLRSPDINLQRSVNRSLVKGRVGAGQYPNG